MMWHLPRMLPGSANPRPLEWPAREGAPGSSLRDADTQGHSFSPQLTAPCPAGCEGTFFLEILLQEEQQVTKINPQLWPSQEPAALVEMLLHCTGDITLDTENTMLVPPKEARIWVLFPWQQSSVHRNNARGNPAPNPLLLAMDIR